MPKHYLTKLLLTPSLLSGVLVLALAFIVLAITMWSFIGERQLFYEYLFGVYGFNTLLLQGPDSIWVLQRAIFDSAATYHLLIILCSMIVGVLVYALLEGMRVAARETSATWRQLHMPGSEYARIAHQNLARQFVRIAALIGWALYTTLFTGALLPTILVLARAGTDSLDMSQAWGWINLLESFVLLVITIHLHVIFMRLVMLRPRLFGVSDVEIAGRQEQP